MDFVASPRFFAQVTLHDPPPETHAPPSTMIPTTSSPRLHVTVRYTMFQNQILRYGHIFTYLPQFTAAITVEPFPFELGTLGMLRTRPLQIFQNLAGVLAHLGVPDSAQQELGLSLTRQIDELAQNNLPRTTGPELRLVWNVERIDDVVHSLPLNEPNANAMRELLAELVNNNSNDNGMVPAAPAALAKLTAVEVESVAGEDCSICLDELAAGGGGSGTAAAMPCKHVFHEQCIVSWLKRSHYCPICRFEMPTAAETVEAR